MLVILLNLTSLPILSAVILTECNSCRSDASFERFARIKFVSNSTTVIILNNRTRESRKYIVSTTNNPLFQSKSKKNQTKGFNDRFAQREYFTSSQKFTLDNFQDVLMSEYANNSTIPIPDDTLLDNGTTLDSTWDLVGNSSNRSNFNEYIVLNIGRISRFTTWLDNVAQKFGLTSSDITVKFQFEFADGSRVLVEVRNELINYLKYEDADRNDIPLEQINHPFSAIHSDLQHWAEWFSWIQSLMHFRLEYAATFDNTCPSLITTCRDVWREDDDEGGTKASGEQQVKIWEQICTLDCNN